MCFCTPTLAASWTCLSIPTNPDKATRCSYPWKIKINATEFILPEITEERQSTETKTERRSRKNNTLRISTLTTGRGSTSSGGTSSALVTLVPPPKGMRQTPSCPAHSIRRETWVRIQRTDISRGGLIMSWSWNPHPSKTGPAASVGNGLKQTLHGLSSTSYIGLRQIERGAGKGAARSMPSFLARKLIYLRCFISPCVSSSRRRLTTCPNRNNYVASPTPIRTSGCPLALSLHVGVLVRTSSSDVGHTTASGARRSWPDRSDQMSDRPCPAPCLVRSCLENETWRVATRHRQGNALWNKTLVRRRNKNTSDNDIYSTVVAATWYCRWGLHANPWGNKEVL